MTLGARGDAGIAYPERERPREPWLDRAARTAWGPIEGALSRPERKLLRLVDRVTAAGSGLEAASDDALGRCAALAGGALRSGLGCERPAAVRLFAIIREAAGRSLGLHPYDVQIMGGGALLDGYVMEMETGEGKTLTATLPAICAALAGVPVHVVTVNDYLAERDAQAMHPLYAFFGLEVGVVRAGMDPQERSRAYACPVTYCTNKELAFDYLKDRLVVGQRASALQVRLEGFRDRRSGLRRLLLRGLHFAIVDEIDSVLVDEARTPLIISGTSGAGLTTSVYRDALAVARALSAREHFRVHGAERRVELTEAGRADVARAGEGRGGPWRIRRHREGLVTQALAAIHLYRREQHYVVSHGEVQIVDEFTGRIYPDRAWEHGLHQLIEAKEGVETTGPRDPLARISHQRFFRRYLRLAGMSGTVREIAGELRDVYGLDVIRIPTNRPVRRRPLGTRVFRTGAEKWTAVAARAEAVSRTGRAVLVGTRSIAASERLSAELTERGIAHRVLNARQDEAEADIVGQAGAPARVTVATNMAGRGTDIVLDPRCAQAGGLHVIATERHESARIDRQLYGRCARQGDPGSYEAALSLDDELLAIHAGGAVRLLLARALRAAPGLGRIPALFAFALAQRRAERLHARIRRELLRADQQLEDALAFAGRRE